MNSVLRFSQLDRTKISNEIEKNECDVLIIGGGITGAGIALDAVTRGLKTVLIEKQDFGAGTSSRSTKLVHGGLRYLENLEFRLVREVGKERAIVHKNAPHLVIPTKMLLPIVKNGSLGRFTTSIGLYIYDMLAGVRKTERKKILSKEQTLLVEPKLKQEQLKGSALYYEYKTDDARLVVEAMKKASSYGVQALNYCVFKEFVYKNKKIVGIKAFDFIENKSIEIRAKTVINASGPWVDQIRLSDNEIKGKKLHITKGIHIVVNQKRLPINNGIYFDVGDGRMIFAIPKKSKVYIGTTDTNYNGEFENPAITQKDIDYLLHATNNMFSNVNLTANDIISSWAGLRPLIHEEGKRPSEMSRKDEIFISSSGLISIAGGKLTGYRKMAERIVDIVVKKHAKKYGLPVLSCKTENIALSGGDFKFYPDIFNIVDYADSKYDEIKQLGISNEVFKKLFYRYGTNIDLIINKAYLYYNEERDSELAILKAEVWYSTHYEMTYTLIDFFIRRTEMLYFEPQKAEQFCNNVLIELAAYFNWNEKTQKKQIENFKEEMNRIKTFA